MCQIENLIPPLLQGLYHHTWQSADVWWQEATHVVTWLFDYGVLWSHIKKLKGKISPFTKPVATKLGRWRGSDHKTKWPLNQAVTWQIENSKVKTSLLPIKEIFNRNILIGSIYFYYIVLIRYWAIFPANSQLL